MANFLELEELEEVGSSLSWLLELPLLQLLIRLPVHTSSKRNAKSLFLFKYLMINVY
ncbi:hypothetical protein GCM10028791_18700 [Echinicola sediminis]